MHMEDASMAARDLGRAIPLHEQALADRQRVLGPDHPDTPTSRNNLAYAYEAAGNLGRAIPLHEQVLADTERVLGPGHPQTLTSRSSLAYAYETAGSCPRSSAGGGRDWSASPGSRGCHRRNRCGSAPGGAGGGAAAVRLRQSP